MDAVFFLSVLLWCGDAILFLKLWRLPTLRAFTALLVAVVLTVILPIANEALVNAEAVLAVVARSGAKQRVRRCEGKTEQVTREASKAHGALPEPGGALLRKQ